MLVFVSVLASLVLAPVTASHSDSSQFASLDKARAQELANKYCEYVTHAFTTPKTDVGDPLWQLMAEDITFCIQGKCIETRKGVFDAWSPSMHAYAHTQFPMTCQVYNFAEKALFFDVIGVYTSLSGEQLIFVLYRMAYLNENGKITQYHSISQSIERWDKWTSAMNESVALALQAQL